jgi:hypothetical protein
MSCFKLTVLFLAGVFSCVSIEAQEALTERTFKFNKEAPAVALNLDEQKWLVGYWAGPGLGGDCDELWMPAQGGVMTGTFRFLHDGKLEFSEIFQLAEHDGKWTLRLKHFHADMKGWEEKDKFVEFPLVKVEPNALYFNGLTYKLNETGNLDVFLAMRNKDGSLNEVTFAFKRTELVSQP